MKQIHCKRKGRSFASRFPGLSLSVIFRCDRGMQMGLSSRAKPSRTTSKRGVSFIKKLADAAARQEMVEKVMKNAFKKEGL